MMDPQVLLFQKELRDRAFILENRRLLSGLLNDCFQGDKARINQLLLAFDCGLVAKVLETNLRDDFFKQRLIGEITRSYGFDKKTADWIVSTWLFCLDDIVIASYKKYIEENKAKAASEIPIQTSKPELYDEEVEVSNDNTPKGFLIPCGVGNEDKGFFVRGIKESKKCNHRYESLFAVVFNYLQRNTTIDEKNDKPQYIKDYEKQLKFEVDYRKVYRLMLVILLMIKNNYIHGDVAAFDYDGDYEEIKIAITCINNYLSLLCRLCKIKDVINLKYQKNPKLKITLRDASGNITAIDCKRKEYGRIIWNAKKIIYHITDDSKSDLEYILREISPYKTFNPGQFEALRDMLNTQAHTVCIMPTGSGKSLIFYLCAILQPGVSFVISPTELLIYDQIENLKNIHRFDDVKNLIYGGDDDFTNFVPKNKIYYLTPETFQNRDLLKEFILLNSNKKIANIILDEVHCISNWSHDFRPEYLMLSSYLNRYLDRTFYKCFTATANYTVIKDIMIQLQINDNKNIISPIKLEKNNIKYTFLACDDIPEMAENSIKFLKKNLIKGQKTLVFTKNDTVSHFFYDSLGDIKYEATLYRKTDRTAYKTFAMGQCKILIASGEVGIGVNLTDVHNVLHFGLPISKGEYVQEIGRAGRNGEPAASMVVYLRCVSKNVKEQLLHRNTSTAEIIDIINNSQEQNDYYDTYRKLIGSIQSQNEFMDLLNQVFKTVQSITDYKEINYDLETIDKTKKCLYILFAIGYVKNWSFCEINTKENRVKMLVGINKNKTLERIKEKTREYLYLVGGNKKSISLVGGASSIEEILNIYIDWYYNHFIYHHKEQFLDMLAFFESYKSERKGLNYSNEINSRLASYFSLSMMEISQDEAKYANLSFKNIAETVISGIDYSTISNIQRINQDNNNIKFDYILFVYGLVHDGEYDSSRMERILAGLEQEWFIDFIESVSIIYEKAEISNRFLLFKALNEYMNDSGFNFEMFFDMIFRQNKRDLIYYGVMAKKINTLIGGLQNV